MISFNGNVYPYYKICDWFLYILLKVSSRQHLLINESKKEVPSIFVDLVLPDDLLERMLAHLPIASILRAGCVCKMARDSHFGKVPVEFHHVLPQKPWYFMFTSSDEPVGYAYDPILQKWYGIDLPCIEISNWFIASLCGLVCLWTMIAGVNYMFAT
ncbi:unnamed protein product [Fraxinus pennsylvanica]|uniref:F-box domain-containing protein n=1 Tax=Fraxinus pennsylvanica TaxID=56036 RepID=A0AAD2DR89_9LAMI|nr:unnamed protein product [Fraxinus pennsylvanica]